MELKLDSDQLKELVGEAILNSFGQEQKNLLVKEAIRSLFAKGTNSYDRRSEIEKVFQDGVYHTARTMIREHFEKDEDTKEKLRILFRDALEVFFHKNREQTVARLAEALQKSFDFKDSNY
jgi:homoserine trans-succinylase